MRLTNFGPIMRYPYEDMGPAQFEDLIVALCRRLLGRGVRGFSAGRDGGRDAKFVGTAEQIPSARAPWEGTTIVQAKHTNGYNCHFGDTDFFSPTSRECVILKEIPRIRALREEGELDHYMLFSNRRLSANKEAEIVNFIYESTNLPKSSIYMCGTEELERHLRDFPEVPEVANIDWFAAPLIVESQQLADIVESLALHRSIVASAIETTPVARTLYADKNRINAMSAGYANMQRRYYLKDAYRIREFLSNPINSDVLEKYTAVCQEFNLKILSKRKDFHSFDEVMEYLLDILFKRDQFLRQKTHRPLTRALIFYMYWNCDVGKTEADDVPAK